MLIRRDQDRPTLFTVRRDLAPRTWRAGDLVRFLLAHEVPIWFGESDDKPEVILSFGPLRPAVLEELRRRFPVHDG